MNRCLALLNHPSRSSRSGKKTEKSYQYLIQYMSNIKSDMIKLKALIIDSINNKVKKDERIGLSANKKLKEISYPESKIKRLHDII